jgi:hypothetical protein
MAIKTKLRESFIQIGVVKYNADQPRESNGEFGSGDNASNIDYKVRFRGNDLEEGTAIVEARDGDKVVGALRWNFYVKKRLVSIGRFVSKDDIINI